MILSINVIKMMKSKSKSKNFKEIDFLIAKNLKIARIVRSLTLREVSLLIGVSGQQVQKYEACNSRIPIDKLVLIAEHLNFSLDFFIKEIKF